MKWYRIWAIMKRHMYQWPRDYENLAEAFWWPTFDMVIWGLTSVYLSAKTTQGSLLIEFIIGSLILWMYVYRSQQEVGFTFLKEVWDRNFLNLMTTPLSIVEFTAASLLLGLVRLCISTIWMGILAYLLFRFNSTVYAFYLIPWIGILLMTGWAAGFAINGLIIRYGFRIQSFAWTLILLIQPFSAVFYPITSMPLWMQYVSKCIAPSYAFEAMRLVIISHTFIFTGFIESSLLVIIYLIGAIWFFMHSFAKAKENGMLLKFG